MTFNRLAMEHTFCFECKTNTLPILMHQMRISTFQVSSVMLRSKKLEIRKKREVKTVKEPSDENQTECHEMVRNLSKDRAMPEGDSPSF
jgi:hypothetical protein